MNVTRYFLLLSLNWIPKIICILFAIFISLFAMDVFGQGAGFLATFVALMAHLIPAFLVVIILILSWKWPWIGGISFIILGIAYVIMMEGKYLIIYIPLFLVGILFLLSWYFRKEIKEARAIYRE
jgi:hypothetical protein